MTEENQKMPQLPLVYSCSGCSSAAQMANYLAIKLDRNGMAEMSCIAGVGGGVKSLVNLAKSGRKIIVLDGCLLSCSKACLSKVDIALDYHFILSMYGVSKKSQEDFDMHQAEVVLEKITSNILGNPASVPQKKMCLSDLDRSYL